MGLISCMYIYINGTLFVYIYIYRWDSFLIYIYMYQWDSFLTCSTSCHKGDTRSQHTYSSYGLQRSGTKVFYLDVVHSCIAVCYSVLQCATVCCSVLQCVTVCCSVLQCVAVCCSVLWCVAWCCIASHRVVVRCSVLQASLRCIHVT